MITRTLVNFFIRTSAVYVALWDRREMYAGFWWGNWRKSHL